MEVIRSKTTTEKIQETYESAKGLTVDFSPNTDQRIYNFFLLVSKQETNAAKMASLLESAAKIMPSVYDEDNPLVHLAADEWLAEFEKFQKGE